MALVVKLYSEKTFNGVSGDVLGAVNCIVFATALIFSI
jgi:cobalamin synthase